MLAYFLAILMAMISLTLYLNAFISPKIHRQDDFLWSGLGLFYALTLWICAGRITGAVLLGQIALVSLTIAFIWENRQIRKAITINTEENSVLEGFSLLNFILTSLRKIPQLTKKKTVTPATSSPSTVEEKPSTSPPEVSSIEANPTVTSEASPSSSESVSSEVLEKPTTVVVPITPTLEKEKEIITEDNLIKEVPQEETKTPESLIKEVIEEEIIDEIPSTPRDGVSLIPEEDDFDALPLSSSSPSESSKGNIFSKIFGFFRKSPKSPSSSETPSPDVIVEEKITDIDLNTTATEVETAIDNLDLVDTDNNQTEINETLPSSEKLESESIDDETLEDNSASETLETSITDNIIETPITDSDNNDNVDSIIEIDDRSDKETEELTEEISEIVFENIDSSSNNNQDDTIDEILDAISDNLDKIELVAETENIEIDTETQEKELEVDEEVPPEDTINTLEDLSFADDTNTISTIEDELKEILQDDRKNE